MLTLTEVSIIIPHKDQATSLAALLESIRRDAPSDRPMEILVLDDDSREPINALCSQYDARLISVTGGRGPAHARNQGAAVASYEWLLFFDSDVEIPEGFFRSIDQTLEERPDTDGLSFVNQAYRTGDSVVRNYGAALEHFWFLDFFEPGRDIAAIRGFTTRNGLIRKSVFETMGGFDTTFQTNAHEDYDFGKRFSATHMALMRRMPLVYHRFPDSLKRLVRNYWVRVTMFVPYFLTHRPKLDKSQTSGKEGVLRLSGLFWTACLVLAALPVPCARFMLLPAAIALAYYLLAVSPFLVRARRASDSWSFMLAFLCLHYVTTIVIATGAVWALCVYCIRPKHHTLKSPIR